MNQCLLLRERDKNSQKAPKVPKAILAKLTNCHKYSPQEFIHAIKIRQKLISCCPKQPSQVILYDKIFYSYTSISVM
jgi:hypothetical protein